MTMRNEELVESFSMGATKGTGSHMFIDGDTIYSHGHHFPIAIRHRDFYLFNACGYSSSTATHKGYVLRALNSEKIIHIEDCDVALKGDQIERNTKEIAELQGKVERARTENSKLCYTQQIEWLKDQNRLIKEMV